MLALALAVALATAGPTSDSSQAISWNGVTLGMRVSQLRAMLGDPVEITPSSDERLARYWIPGSDSTFFFIVEQRGYVAAFHAFTEATPSSSITTVPADPSGVRLGDTMQSIEQLHPGFQTGAGDNGDQTLIGPGPTPHSGIGYDFDGGRLHSFDWVIRLPQQLPILPPISEPDGTSIANAIMDVQSNEMDGVHWEYIFIEFQACDGNTSWRPSGTQALLDENGKTYDRDHAICPRREPSVISISTSRVSLESSDSLPR
jgi:hypothetical protein